MSFGKEFGYLSKKFRDVLTKVPESREKALDAAGEVLKTELDRQIVQQLPNSDSHGHVRSWQQISQGSRHGWAAVGRVQKSRSEKIDKKGHTSYDVTKWLEHGHEIGTRSGRARGNTRYWDDYEKGRSMKSLVNERTGNLVAPGFGFYSWARLKAEKTALNAAQQVLADIKKGLDE